MLTTPRCLSLRLNLLGRQAARTVLGSRTRRTVWPLLGATTRIRFVLEWQVVPVVKKVVLSTPVDLVTTMIWLQAFPPEQVVCSGSEKRLSLLQNSIPEETILTVSGGKLTLSMTNPLARKEFGQSSRLTPLTLKATAILVWIVALSIRLPLVETLDGTLMVKIHFRNVPTSRTALVHPFLVGSLNLTLKTVLIKMAQFPKPTLSTLL